MFPKTRYQGSKGRVLGPLSTILSRLDFDSALDAFGGTGAVSYALKRLGKAVTYNDALRWNYEIARALIENDSERLPPEEAERLPEPRPGLSYRAVVAEHFPGIYFTAEEDEEIDRAIQNSRLLPGFSGDLARYTLYQACLIKRPYNLFHRANLGLRLAEVSRSFGNKRSWDRPLREYLPRFAREANAAIFQGARPCRARAGDVMTLEGDFDLVYADPPYVSARGVGVDYLAFYHFLEGLSRYEEWPALIDFRYRHRPLKAPRSPWSDPGRIRDQLASFFERFARSILVFSYREDGLPSPEEIVSLLRRVKHTVEVHSLGGISYALSRGAKRELVFVAR